MRKKAGGKRVSACVYTARPEFKIRSLRDDRFLVMQNDIRLTDCAVLEL